MFARPHGTYSPDETVAVLRGIAETEGVEAIILGWPLAPDGKEGEAVRRVLPFRNRLRNQLPGVPIVQWDERESSRRATAALVDADVPRGARRKRGRLDRAAAAIILQEYLDEHHGTGSE
jgi:putative holliday junction resolvase